MKRIRLKISVPIQALFGLGLRAYLVGCATPCVLAGSIDLVVRYYMAH